MSKSGGEKRRADENSKKTGGVAAEPKVEIDSEVTRRIRQHARAHSKTEVCGVLIGESTDATVDIRASIEALNAAQAGTHVTFTQDAWEEIYRVKDELYPDERIVGWYHSHPGFGVFLSEHDLFIQQNFFSSPGQVAWVYDPHTDEEGCFGWVGGEIHRLSSLAMMDRNGDGVERTPKRANSSLPASDEDEDGAFEGASGRREATPAWVRWSRIFLTHVSMLLVGFAIAYFLFPRIFAVMVDPATGQVVLRDGEALLPYLNQRVPLPGGVEVQPGPAPASPPSATPPSAATAPAAPAPAQPASPRSHQ
jgi:proteasome lid subunit RPN8/RPN11